MSHTALDSPQDGMSTAITNPPTGTTRVDLLLIVGMVAKGAKVLDVGSGDGTLLHLLETRKDVDGRGIEIKQERVNRCVAKGLSVIQGDADKDLADYPDQSFDYAILSQTLQATRRPRYVLEELLRIGRHAIVSLPNFAHWKIRGQLIFRGRMPETENLPYKWYDTPNIHLCTLKDFRALCDDIGASIEDDYTLNAYGYKLPYAVPLFLQNLIGEQAVFLLKK
jgi:methionine biosynthesis protein MetW